MKYEMKEITAAKIQADDKGKAGLIKQHQDEVTFNKKTFKQ